MSESRLTLFHAGGKEIKTPDICIGRKNADFGQGFYLTPDKEFAYRWAPEDAFVNEYILETEGLEIHRFSRTPEWFRYILGNRSSKDTLDADVVIGPVAVDTIYDTLGILSSGFISPEDALQLLCIGPLYTQAAIKSEKAASALTWIGSEKVRDREKYRALVKKEQEDFLEAFSEGLHRITAKSP